jgi:hypothetical protein
MRISLKNKSSYVEHTTIRFYTGVPEAALIKALGKLDDGEIEFIEVPNDMMPTKYLTNYILPEFYLIEF